MTVNGATRALVDGGVFINSPVVSAYTEEFWLLPEDDDIVVVSIGTGEHGRPISYNEARSLGRLGLALPLLSSMFEGVADAANYQMKTLLRNNDIRLQTENIENLKLEAKTL